MVSIVDFVTQDVGSQELVHACNTYADLVREFVWLQKLNAVTKIEDPDFSIILEKCVDLGDRTLCMQRVLRQESNAVNKIKKIILDSTKIATSFSHLNDLVFANGVCRYRSRYTNYILSSIKDIYIVRRAEQEHRRMVMLLRKQQRKSYVVLTQEGADPEMEWVEEGSIDVYRPTVRPRRAEPIFYGPYHIPRPSPPPRNLFLVKKLRLWLEYLRESRFVKSITRLIKPSIINAHVDQELRMYYSHDTVQLIDEIATVARPEMDVEGAHGTIPTQSSTASNVTLISDSIPSVEKTTIEQPSWTHLCSSDVNPSYSSVTDRWLQLETFPWNKDQTSNTFLASYLLPHDIVAKEQLGSACAMPNLMAFNVHRYWRGDMEIKVQVNCNKFQIGSLQVAWLYCPDFDERSLYRKNIYSLSQTNHCLITANTSNEAILRIPYKYYLPLMHTKPRSDMPTPLAMGRLFITVVNPLTVPTGGPGKANVTVFVRFIDSEFTGMLAGNIDPLPNTFAQPEMDRAVNAVTAGLNSLFSDPNRDNPPQVRAPMFMVPTASHSWSAGTAITEPLHPLRLDARGQTPHPPGCTASQEMTVNDITSIFGLVKILEWSKQDMTGKILFDFDAAPFLHRRNYESIVPKANNQLTGFYLPPVAVVSSMYMGWRGSLEFRFDVVASQYHTGRIMIAYVPGASASTPMTLAKLRASTNVVYTLNDTTQFSFTVPYVANKPVWPRKYGGDFRPTDNLSPSRVYIAVINELIPMQNVSDKVYLNMYMRGGPDFELIVPVQPSLGLLNNNQYIVNVNKPSVITALDTYSPYYSGSFEDLNFAQCYRWGQYSHQIAHFTASNWYDAAVGNYTYCLPMENINTYPLSANDKGTLVKPGGCVFVYLQETGYVIGIPTPTAEAARNLSYNIFVRNIIVNSDENKPYFFQNTWSTSSNKYSEGNPQWKVVIEKKSDWRADEYDEDSLLESFVNIGKLSANIEGERDTVQDIQGLGTVATTNSGMKLYGEKFNSLKDLIRRYQLYGVYTLNSIKVTDSDKIKFAFPCVPQGLLLNIGTKENVNELFNRGRDGHIPLIASGYRFYRGGLRFRIVFDSDPDICVYIQHRPDRILSELRITDHTTILSGETVANHTYASYLQLTSVNGIVEFEVPYYMFGLYGLLQQPKITQTDESNFFSLGEISVGVILNNLNKTPKKLMWSIYYSGADDLSFSTFQGFPPMCFTSDVPQSTAVAKPEGLFNWITDPVVDNVKQEIATSSKNLAVAIRDKIQDLDMNYRDTIIKMALSLAHTFVDQTPKTLILSVISVLLEMKILIFDNLTSLIGALSEAVMSWVQRVSNERITENSRIPQASPEMFFDTFTPKDWVKTLGLLFAGITAAVGITCTPPKDMSSFAKIFSTHIPNATRGGNFVISFISSVLDVAKAFLKWILSKIYPIEAFYYTMEEDLPDVKLWVNEVNFLTRQNLTNVIDFDGIWIDRVTTAVDFGHALIERCIEADDKQVHILSKIQDKIMALYDKLTAMGKHPFVRREPFCIWVAGKPGIGKSFLMEFLSSALLESESIVTRGAKVFTVMPATEHWTGCRDQPVLNLDDAFSVEMGETLERQLNIMYMVKSPVALNPPMASLEDKFVRYNPEIFYINSNKTFLNISGLDPSAIHRRRDVLIEAVLKPNVTKDMHFSHLTFNILDANDAKSVFRKNMSYQQLVTWLIPKFQEFRHQEELNYQERVNSYTNITQYETGDLRLTTTLKQQMVELRRAKELQYRHDVRNSVFTKFQNFSQQTIDYWMQCKQSLLVKVLPANGYYSKLGALWPTTAVQPEMVSDVLMGLYQSECEAADNEMDTMFEAKNYPKARLCDQPSTSHEAEDETIFVDGVSSVTSPILVETPNPPMRRSKSVTDLVIDMDEEWIEQLYKDRELQLWRDGDVDNICTFFHNVMPQNHPDRSLTPCELVSAYFPSFVNIRDYLFLTHPNELPVELPIWVIRRLIPWSGLFFFTNSQRFVVDYRIFNFGMRFLNKQQRFLFDTIWDRVAYTNFRERRLVDNNLMSFKETKIYKDAEARKEIEFKKNQEKLAKDLAERTVQQIAEEREKCLEERRLDTLVPVSMDKYGHIVTKTLRQVEEERRNHLAMLKHFKISEVILDVTRLIIPHFTLHRTDIDFMKFGHQDSGTFDGTNYTDKFKVWVPSPKKDKYYYYKKPWLIWEIIRLAIKDCFACSHVHGECEWDYDAKCWRAGTVTMPNLLQCPSGNCPLKYPIFRRYFNIYHIFNTSIGRAYHAKKNLEVLPMYFRDEIEDLTQLAGTWFQKFLIRAKDILKDFCVPKLLQTLKFFGILALSFGAVGFISWVANWAITSWCGPATVTPPVASAPLAQDTSALFLPPVAGEKAYTMDLKPAHKVVSFTHGNMAAPQGFTQNYNDVIRRINGNAFIITAETMIDGITKVNRARGLGLRANQAIFIKHYYQHFGTLPLANTKFYLERLTQGTLGNRVEIDYSALMLRDFIIQEENYQTNFCIIEFPPYIPFFKDITKHIATVAEQQNSGSQGDLISFGTGNHLGLSMYVKKGLQISGEGGVEPVACYSVYAYPVHGAGMCGSVLLARNLPSKPIIGLHVAGLGGEGYSEPIFRDMFDNKILTPSTDFEELEVDDHMKAKVFLRTSILPDGIVKPEMEHQETGKTQFTPSLIQGTFPIDTEPNPLTPRDARITPHSPMQLGCEKHGMPVSPFNVRDVNAAMVNYRDVIMHNVKPSAAGAVPWSLNDAVCGNPDIPHCEPLDWGTSPGFGYNSVRKGKKGKKFLFDLEENNSGFKLKGVAPLLKEIMTHKQDLRLKGVVPVTVFTDCLKDTCLPLEKCRIPGKTRIFSISPVDFTIQFRQYFGAFMAAYTEARFDAEHAIGINVDGPEWSKLAHKMQQQGEHILDGDYKDYGPRLPLQLVLEAFEIILFWYKVHGASDASQKIRRIFILEFINAPHLCFNLLYRCYAGIPSGSPITSILNSMVNSILIRLAFINTIKPEYEGRWRPSWAMSYDVQTTVNPTFAPVIFGETLPSLSMSVFRSVVDLVSYGDDIFMNVHAAVVPYFNVTEIQRYFASHGIVFTNSKKTDALWTSVKLTEISFLSREFKQHPTRRYQWLAPLKITSIHSCVNWISRKNDPVEATKQNAEAAQALAYGHGRAFYDKFSIELSKAMSRANIAWTSLSFDAIDERVFGSISDIGKLSFINQIDML